MIGLQFVNAMVVSMRMSDAVVWRSAVKMSSEYVVPTVMTNAVAFESRSTLSSSAA